MPAPSATEAQIRAKLRQVQGTYRKESRNIRTTKDVRGAYTVRIMDLMKESRESQQ